MTNFTKIIKNYKLDYQLVLNLKKSNYKKPTFIQMQAIPILIEKRNLIALAPTGSGKTLAYAIPIIHNLKENK